MPLKNDEFIPPKVSGYFPTDLANITPQLPNYERPRAKPSFAATRVYQDDYGEIFYWKLMVTDLGGGYGPLQGSFEELHDKIIDFTSSDDTNYKGNLDTRFYRTACLPVTTTTDDPGATWSSPILIGCNCYGRMYLGHYDGTNVWRETNSTTPTLEAEYTVPDNLFSLQAISLGSATASQRLFVGLDANGVKIINEDGTTAATMHADTTDCWGIIQTPTLTPDHPDPLLIYAGSSLMTLDKDQVETTQPTTVLTGVPRGGRAIGLGKIGGGDYRAYWLWPLNDQPTGMFTYSLPAYDRDDGYGRIVSTNLEGTEYQEVPISLPRGVRDAIIVNESIIIAHDGSTLMYYDGRTVARDLKWNEFLFPESDRDVQIKGLAHNGPEVLVAYTFSDGIRIFNKVDGYDLTQNSWHPVAWLVDDDEVDEVWGLPLSVASRNWYLPKSAHSMVLTVPKYGTNTYSLRQTSSSSAGTIVDATTLTLLPAWELPGFEGWPKTIERLTFLGDIDTGGSGASVKFYVFPPDTVKDYSSINTLLSDLSSIPNVTISPGQKDRVHHIDWTDQSLLYRIQIGIHASRDASDTKKNINVLPFALEGYCYVGRPNPPVGFLTDLI